MEKVRPKTYNEFVRYKQCLILKSYIPDMSNELFNKIYDFLSRPGNKLVLSEDKLKFTNVANLLTEILEVNTDGSIYASVVVSAAAVTVNHMRMPENITPDVFEKRKNYIFTPNNNENRSSGCSGCSGCGSCGGGCGGNNNNNNNNNA